MDIRGLGDTMKGVGIMTEEVSLVVIRAGEEVMVVEEEGGGS